MNVAIVGWGSLVWCPGSLRIKTRWRLDGPWLPIEFARISQDGRLTLVIYPNSKDQRTYWALSEFTSLDEARHNVSERENAKVPDIHYLNRNGGTPKGITQQIVERLNAWLATHDDIRAVVWTGLRSNWTEKRGREFTVDDAVSYLRTLEFAGPHDAIICRAREYVRNTAPNIQTRVREKMRALGWEDVDLPKILFES
jgi:hypothetical protein